MGFFGKKRVNPETGEVKRSGLRKAFHAPKIEKSLRPIAKVALPVIGSGIGGLMGGPLGSILGGAGAGALSSKSHRLDHALGGAGAGFGYGAVAPWLGGKMGLDPASMAGRAMLMEQPSLLNQLGFGGNYNQNPPSMGGGSNQSSSTGVGGFSPGVNKILKALVGKGKTKKEKEGEEEDELTTEDLIKLGLMGISGTGMLMARSKTPNQQSIQEIMAQSRPQWGPQHQARKVKPLQRKYKTPPIGYRPGIDPEWEYFEEANPEIEYYAHGGAVGNYIDGPYGGQEDNIDMEIPEGAYVLDATTVSLLGDGNSKNGAEKIKKFKNSLNLSSGVISDYNSRPTRTIKAKLSSGEDFLEPQEVARIGKGNHTKGVKKLDEMRKKLRGHKGVKSILPPKSKPIMSYMR
jgi:hypothetical protein